MLVANPVVRDIGKQDSKRNASSGFWFVANPQSLKREPSRFVIQQPQGLCQAFQNGWVETPNRCIPVRVLAHKGTRTSSIYRHMQRSWNWMPLLRNVQTGCFGEPVRTDFVWNRRDHEKLETHN